jgi:hypothetical protein
MRLIWAACQVAARRLLPAIWPSPALTLVGGLPSPAQVWDVVGRQAMVQFLDGTWRLCRLADWQRRDADTWLCDLH